MNRRQALFSIFGAIMASRPTYFNEDARKRIANVVRRVERSPYGAGEDGGATAVHAHAFCLVQSAAYHAPGSFDSDYKIMYTPTTKGSESATSITTFPGFVYVRQGVVLPDVTYVAMQLDLGFEIMNPTLMVRGQPTADATAGSTTSTFTVYGGALGSEASLSQTISNVRNDSSCTVKGSQMATIGWIQAGNAGGWQYIQGKTV